MKQPRPTVTAGDEHPDAVPELSRAVHPEAHYAYLVARPHPWRKQLAFKDRRLTVGQFLGRMRAEGWTPEEAAADFDLPVEAAYEALEYGECHASLIAAEEAEDARAARNLTDGAVECAGAGDPPSSRRVRR
ncbi:MAG: hypothetical protein JWM87_2503 [Candidatus Eremiobacteraeota bacterium]|nr:hypothetical protein [Candidatus Eremiobacteraeota bacterium]